jgi:hypothetical protein
MRVDVEFKEIKGEFDLQLNESESSFDAIFEHYQGGADAVEAYDGEYEVTPRIEAQTLQTAEKLMVNDVTVHAIPYAEVTNTAGGITATIG